MKAEKIGWNNVHGNCVNCTDCPYFEAPKEWRDTEVTAYCHYFNSTPHSIDRFDIYRCQRIMEEHEQYTGFCNSVIGTARDKEGRFVIYTE